MAIRLNRSLELDLLCGLRILFSNPPHWAEEKPQNGTGESILRGGIRAGSRWPFTRRSPYAPDRFIWGSYLPFPFFLGYAASWAQRAFPKDEVMLRDSIARGESYDSYKCFLYSWRPDWIVLESGTSSWEHDMEIIKGLAKICPQAKVILTGPVVDNQKVCTEAIREGVVSLVHGEYEQGCVEAIRGHTGEIPHMLMTSADMNAAPIPMMDDGCWWHYWDACPVGQRPNQLQLWASRGCWAKCSFCVWPAVMTGNDPDGTKTRKPRFYCADYIEDYLRQMMRKHRYHCVYFDDDTFNLSDKHTLEICVVMRKMGLPWAAMCRADTSSREVWKEMKASGCFGVKLGFESGSQRVVDQIINKHLDLEEAKATRFFLRDIGITVHGTFTVGLPGETDEERQQTIKFIEELELDSHQLSGTAEIDGTPLANMKKGEALKAYPAAVKDDSYEASPDGNLKIEGMIH